MAKNSFQKVFDSRGRRVRGLWRRNDIYYAQLSAGGGRSAMFRLHNATTVPQASESMQALKKQRRDGNLVANRRQASPPFSVFADAYITQIKDLGLKRPLTIHREQTSLAALKSYFQMRPVHGITAADVMNYATDRRKAGISGRSIDVDVIALRHVLKKAVRDGFQISAPNLKWESLSDGPAQVRLVSRQEIDAMKAAADNQQFADYLELMACSGGREQETIRLRWSVNVNWAGGLLGFGQDGLSKFGKMRWVPFNPQLEAHLKSMRLRSGNSDWLFQSRYSAEHCVTTYRKILLGAMEKAGVKNFGFHHLRHYFISHAVMAKVDFKTIAEWVAHKDGGVLIGKTYSHLTPQHSAQQAAKVML